MRLKEFNRKYPSADSIYKKVEKIVMSWEKEFISLVKNGKVNPSEHIKFLEEKRKEYGRNS